MSTIIEGSFTSHEFSCPVCGLNLVPPVTKYCDHIAFYCVVGPVDDPFFEYQAAEIVLTMDDILSEEKLLNIQEENGLSIHKFTEQDAYYPTEIILGIKQ
jgi:hypothetical protein